MSRIFWDTNLFIYLFEDYGALSKATTELRKKMLTRGDQLMTSTLTLAEILVKPIERGDMTLSAKYENAVTTASIMLSFAIKAAKIYASLRSDRALRAPDAIQLACGAAAGVDLFVTNDHRLQGRQVDGIQFIVPLERIPI
jgi:predicted nucleic acid-binding protein